MKDIFKIELKNKIPLNDIKVNSFINREYNNELDDGRSVISDICEIFADSGKIIFSVSGLGEENWPVDCRFDLPIIIEQLPEIFSKMNNNDFNFKLDFYEQGIEREINFIDNEDIVNLECTYRNDRVPMQVKIEMRKEIVSAMFRELYDNFLLFSTVLCNSLANNRLLKIWMDIK